MKSESQKQGFTIVEMLTVMGIIAILIGLLVPALTQVKDYAARVRQKAQFHSMDVALEIFKTDFGAYPGSNNNLDALNAALNHPANIFAYTGANKLAESMVGLDLLGFHPNSDFRTTGINQVVNKDGTTANWNVYWPYDDSQMAWQTASENLKARSNYIDSENANAYRMNEIYPAANLAASWVNNYATPSGSLYPVALCDTYSKKRQGIGNKKTGMPILYFRARTAYSLQDVSTVDLLTGLNDDIYYAPDNYQLLALGTPEIAPQAHPLFGTGAFTNAANSYALNFENMILNQQLLPVKRPYRASSYILISAGKDGLYGTSDDIFNFDKGTEQ